MYELKLVNISNVAIEGEGERVLPLAKPHGICIGSKERHAAGTFGDLLRVTVLVSQGADKA